MLIRNVLSIIFFLTYSSSHILPMSPPSWQNSDDELAQALQESAQEAERQRQQILFAGSDADLVRLMQETARETTLPELREQLDRALEQTNNEAEVMRLMAEIERAEATQAQDLRRQISREEQEREASEDDLPHRPRERISTTQTTPTTPPTATSAPESESTTTSVISCQCANLIPHENASSGPRVYFKYRCNATNGCSAGQGLLIQHQNSLTFSSLETESPVHFDEYTPGESNIDILSCGHCCSHGEYENQCGLCTNPEAFTIIGNNIRIPSQENAPENAQHNNLVRMWPIEQSTTTTTTTPTVTTCQCANLTPHDAASNAVRVYFKYTCSADSGCTAGQGIITQYPNSTTFSELETESPISYENYEPGVSHIDILECGHSCLTGEFTSQCGFCMNRRNFNIIGRNIPLPTRENAPAGELHNNLLRLWPRNTELNQPFNGRVRLSSILNPEIIINSHNETIICFINPENHYIMILPCGHPRVMQDITNPGYECTNRRCQNQRRIVDDNLILIITREALLQNPTGEILRTQFRTLSQFRQEQLPSRNRNEQETQLNQPFSGTITARSDDDGDPVITTSHNENEINSRYLTNSHDYVLILPCGHILRIDSNISLLADEQQHECTHLRCPSYGRNIANNRILAATREGLRSNFTSATPRPAQNHFRTINQLINEQETQLNQTFSGTITVRTDDDGDPEITTMRNGFAIETSFLTPGYLHGLVLPCGHILDTERNEAFTRQHRCTNLRCPNYGRNIANNLILAATREELRSNFTSATPRPAQNHFRTINQLINEQETQLNQPFNGTITARINLLNNLVIATTTPNGVEIDHNYFGNTHHYAVILPCGHILRTTDNAPLTQQYACTTRRCPHYQRNIAHNLILAATRETLMSNLSRNYPQNINTQFRTLNTTREANPFNGEIRINTSRGWFTTTTTVTTVATQLTSTTETVRDVNGYSHVLIFPCGHIRRLQNARELPGEHRCSCSEQNCPHSRGPINDAAVLVATQENLLENSAQNNARARFRTLDQFRRNQ